MRFDPPLLTGRFLRRYKRFFADVALDDGEVVVTHCPNTGSLTGCLVEGAPVAVAHVDNPKRKLKYTWKMIHVDDTWIGVDTSCANALVDEAIVAGAIPELAGFERVIPEVKYGENGGSRIDLLLSSGGRLPEGTRSRRALPEGDQRVYVEVKNTTLAFGSAVPRTAAFPDAVTERGRKHLSELIGVIASGQRAAMVFSIQRADCETFTPADAIDPAYGVALRAAVDAGVEVYALCAAIDPGGITLTRQVPVEL